MDSIGGSFDYYTFNVMTLNHIKLCEGRVTLENKMLLIKRAFITCLLMFMFSAKTLLVDADDSEEEAISKSSRGLI